MAALSTVLAGLTLPPKVEGRVTGHLVMKVDEVLWARKPPGEVSAVVMWWGGEEPTTFRPSDVAENSVKRKNLGVIYEIHTTLSLFEKYLSKCGSLEIAIADKYGMPIGCVSVPKLRQIVNCQPFQGYYPIVNNFGNRIGDLHVSFNLRMLTSVDNSPLPTASSKQGVTGRDYKSLNFIKSKQLALTGRSKEEKTKKNEKLSKRTPETSELDPSLSKVGHSVKCENVSPGYEELVHQQNQSRRVSPTTNIISQILEHGTRLRDAMAASVMEDCVQLDKQNLPSLGTTGLSNKKSQITLDSNQQHIETEVVNLHSEMKINPLVEKKVLDYLSGKPMSDTEESEALAALRSITPTKDILETVVSENNLVTLQEGNPKEKVIDLCESSEVVTKITEYSSASAAKHLYDVDSELLSQVNCLRITIHSLIFNSVGIKRLRPPSKKKGTSCQSGITLQPPGITYFVEYKFPLPGSRPWESTVRYCSKRFYGHEVLFGDRTVHNLPISWRSSLSDESNLGSFISSLSIKVCARHLHQRIPLLLGSAELNTVKPLFESTNLRHDFDLPVTAPDCLPVAQLRLCVELGRDRIHFGGLLDPENNSLGLSSPKRIATPKKAGSSSLKTSGKVKPSRSVTTVTRNITPIPSSVSKIRKKLPVRQAALADKVMRQIVKNVSSKRYQPSESSSAPSTGRPHLKPNTNLPNCLWSSTYEIDCDANPDHLNASMKNQLVKHEMALNILEIVGLNTSQAFIGGDQGFYVTYKFPVFDVTKTKSVDWQSFQTELSVDADGKWKRSQHRIHPILLCEFDSFHSFLLHALKLRGKSDLVFIRFFLYARYFGTEVKDQLIAEATLPMSMVSTLEDAYLEAAKMDPNFSSSSCSSVILELPFNYCAVIKNQECSKSCINLRIKLDYRHVKIDNLNHEGNLPRSQGDSALDNIHSRFIGVEESHKFVQKTGGKLSGQELGAPAPVVMPNWARAADQQLLISSRLKDVNKHGKISNDLSNRIGQDQVSMPPPEELDAVWAPMHDNPLSKTLSCLAFDSNADPIASCPYGHKECKTASITSSFENCYADISGHVSKISLPLSSEHWKSQDKEQEDPVIPVDSSRTSGSHHPQATTKMKDMLTSLSSSRRQEHSLSRDLSPLPKSLSIDSVHDKATCTEKDCGYNDKALQVVTSTVNKECQTTPRETKEVLRRNMEVVTDICGLSMEEKFTPLEISTFAQLNPSGSMTEVEVKNNDNDQSPSVHDGICSVESKKEDCRQNMEKMSCNNLDESSDKLLSFRANIGVECALHVQSVESTPGIQGKLPSYVFVSLHPCEVDCHLAPLPGSPPILFTQAVINNGEPAWHWQTSVELPSDMLYWDKKRLVFKVWQSSKIKAEPCVQDLGEACTIGFSALDLTVLSAGLPFISGWYNIMDFTGACRGQIKLSVKPSGHIPKIINLSIANDDAQNKNPQSMFVTHSVYKQFPSHVVQFPEICVQRVDSVTGHQEMSTVLSSYQDIIQHCEKQKNEMSSTCASEILVEDSEIAEPSEKILTEECHERDCVPSRASSSSVDPSIHASAMCPDPDVQRDPSQVLREKLSELDTITKFIKSRLMNRVPSSHTMEASGLFQKLSIGEKLEQRSQTDSKIGANVPDASGEIMSVCHHGAEDQGSSHKQRRMWEKQGDLIDIGALQIDCESDIEKSTPGEDLSDWLSESALQQVFNPFLFNDLLNNMNSASGVKVIEVDDTENSHENLNLATVAHSEYSDSAVHERNSKASLKKTSKRCSRRGDETYRKEAPLFGFSRSQERHTGTPVCDADSGVDVDVSANFNPSTLLGAVMHHRNAGVCVTSNEREEASSCSRSSSTHVRSTLPSASATPTDSPQHSRHEGSKHRPHADPNLKFPAESETCSHLYHRANSVHHVMVQGANRPAPGTADDDGGGGRDDGSSPTER